MENILEIARYDIKHLFKNAISLIVLAGLILIPSMYAWFNTQASWDPYANTKAIHIAVANDDLGYKSDLMPVQINLGESVLNSLRKDDNFTWEVVSTEQAQEGVAAGDYYASIVIPESFSRDMLTFFSSDAVPASITYYSNEKLNAIAPKITEKGATSLQRQINEDFSATVDTVILSVTTDLVGFLDSDQLVSYTSALVQRLDSVIATTQDASEVSNSFSDLIDSASSLLNSTANLGNSLNETASGAADVVEEVEGGLNDITSSFDSAADVVDVALQESATSYGSVSSAIDSVYNNANTTTESAIASLNSISTSVSSHIDSLVAVRNALSELNPITTPGKDSLNTMLANLDASIEACTNLKDAIDNSVVSLQTTQGNVQDNYSEIVNLVEEAQTALNNVSASYDSNLKKQISDLQTSLGEIRTSADDAASNLQDALKNLQQVAGGLADNLDAVKTTLSDANVALNDLASDLSGVRDGLSDALQSEDLNTIRTIIGSDSNGLVNLLSSPVTVHTESVYPVKNYGSVMVAYYDALSIWIGATILAAMLYVKPSDDCLAHLDNVKEHERYLGHFVMFALIATCQGLLIGFGCVFFLRIQCLHPAEFIFACWLASIVFTAIVYTLTVSFGDVGKALAVLLLVIQVAGSGGTFPIQMTPPFFQALAPYLPFTPLMNALHACVGGIWGNEFWSAMLSLSAFLIPALLLGLVLRKPVIRLNDYISAKLEETKLM